MLFVIYALDKNDALRRRNELYGAHRDHVDRAQNFGVEIKIAGPLAADDHLSGIGSIYIVEAKDRAAVESFSASDPYLTEGVWGSVTIHPFLKRRG